MDKEKRLVIKLVKSLAAKHQDMSFKYGYIPMIGHVVEVGPLEMFDNFEKYGIDENDAQAKFITEFPDKGLMFISNDPFAKVEDPIFQTGPKSASGKSGSNSHSSKSFWVNLGRALGL